MWKNSGVKSGSSVASDSNILTRNVCELLMGGPTDIRLCGLNGPLFFRFYIYQLI